MADRAETELEWDGPDMGLHEECGVFGIYDPAGGCGDRRPAASPPSMTGSSPFIRMWAWSARYLTNRPFSG